MSTNTAVDMLARASTSDEWLELEECEQLEALIMAKKTRILESIRLKFGPSAVLSRALHLVVE